ncbi:phage anti-RecBCD protein [Buttiauxella gaviniae]|uniref:phage anti-RecBCD protein n=1 Tax=Buttiauxella gaviniae TaxID=82990 RepID=UPI0039B0B2ED
MPSPLNRGADNPRQCSAGSKAEVLANFARYWEQSQGSDTPAETKRQRMERQADSLADSQLWHDNYRASFLPAFQIVGPHLPHKYTDDRSRVRLGRFGHRTSD